APSEEKYIAGVQELLATANTLFDELGLGEVRTETRTRSPRREPRKTDNLISAYEHALLRQGERHKHLVALDADLIKDCGLVSFAKRFPDRFVECGIAEQDMVSIAGGMARRGALAVVHSFACFLSARPNEQIYNQCSEGTKVIYVGSLAGLIPGGPGHSHQSVRDISALRGVPHLSLLEPCMEAEVGALVDYAVNTAVDSVYLRLVSVKWPIPFGYPSHHKVEIGKGWVVRDGDDAICFGYGPWMMASAYEAVEEIEQSTGATIRLVHLPWIYRSDLLCLCEVVG